jgi:hypothetical protein
MPAEGTAVFIGLYSDFVSILPKAPWTSLNTNAATITLVIIDRDPAHQIILSKDYRENRKTGGGLLSNEPNKWPLFKAS